MDAIELVEGQDSPSTDQELKESFEKDRKATRDESIKSAERHPRCALLPSPEKLYETIGSQGSDKTDTLGDFDQVKGWVTNSKLTDFHSWDIKADEAAASGTEGKNLSDEVFYGLILNAFSTAFVPMRNTASPELEELVFWYYAGHGLGKKAAEKLPYSSTPYLTGRDARVKLDPKYHEVANEFVKENRKVKGGELCLHKVGFCDLYGLLKPWIAAIKAKSINAEGEPSTSAKGEPSTSAKGSKKNKHLVIILDSCYSGIIAQELKDFEDHMNEQYPKFWHENSVTIQAACGPDQRALGGYFTPCFIYLNDPKNAKLLIELKAVWMGMTEEKKNEYKSIQLPSPMVVTTRTQSRDVTMELTIQNLKLTLFQDPGFFKFCSVKVYQHQDESLFDGKDRVLGHTSANDFMKSQPFIVLDYKLKTLVNGPYAGSPMGLFLLEDRKKPGYTVCAHIHFETGNTNNHQRINLVHHREPPVGSLLFLHEDHDGLSRRMISRNRHKIQVPLDGNAENLVRACHAYVESKEPGRWNTVLRWNMTGHQLGFNGLFRVQERQKQRSAWEDNYLKQIEKYDLPKV